MVDGREHEATGVAARLRAFHDAPALYRARYLRGEETLPDGAFVLRFAQGRFPPSIASDWPAGEAQRVRAAAEAFLRQVCLRDEADHFQALCAERDASAETIKENYHLLMALLHPDRQDASSAPWPAGCAQRVNIAYATLGDEHARRRYRAGLLAPPRREAPRARRTRGATGAGDARLARSLIAVSVVMAGFAVVLLLVHEDEWSDRSLMDSAISALRTRPERNVDRPRYVGASALAPAIRASDAASSDERPSAFSFLKPLIARLAPAEPKPWEPEPQIVAQAPAQAAAPPIAFAAVVEPPKPSLRRSEALIATKDEPAPSKVAQAAAPSAAQPAQVGPSAASASPSSRDIEGLVVALIGYYEAGDVDKLIGLVDTRQAGFWRSEQLRQRYVDFFRATRARSLRVERLAWSSQPGAARARGEAIVRAEYFDQSAPVERRVPVEMDVGVRDGRAVITRLSLFPDTP